MKLRKLFAGIAAAATMLGGLAIGSTAAQAAGEAGTATIKVHFSQTGHTYSAYKFATFSNPTNDDAAKTSTVDVATDDGWNDVLKNAVVAAGLTEVPSEYANNYAAYLATLGSTDLRKVASNLNLTGKTADATVAGTDGQDAVLHNLAEGWYLVTDTNAEGQTAGATAIVASTLAGVKHLKLKTPLEQGQGNISGIGEFNSKGTDHVTPPPTKTAENAESGTVNVGDEVIYKVTTEVPASAAGYTDYTVTFKDVASKGLQLPAAAEEFTVSVKDGAAAKPTFTLEQTGDPANGTTTIITVTNADDYAGKTLVLTYTATVTADAVDTVTNSASVKNNTDTESEGHLVTLKTGKFHFIKVGKDGHGLNGVVFNIYAGSKAEGEPLVFTKGADDTYVKAAEGADGAAADLVTAFVKEPGNRNGVLSVRGLADGTYTVKETKALEGFSSTFLAQFTVAIKDGVATINTDDANGLVTKDKKTGEAQVLNVKNITELPQTGAAGIVLFVVIGALLAGAAATVYGKSRKTRAALRA